MKKKESLNLENKRKKKNKHQNKKNEP